MTATDRLRALLDERGARWTACSKATIDNQTYCYGHTYTEFQAGLMVTDLTPEQAVEATLGRGTCKRLHVEGKSFLDGKPFIFFKCSECDSLMGGTGKYCPSCGREIVE